MYSLQMLCEMHHLCCQSALAKPCHEEFLSDSFAALAALALSSKPNHVISFHFAVLVCTMCVCSHPAAICNILLSSKLGGGFKKPLLSWLQRSLCCLGFKEALVSVEEWHQVLSPLPFRMRRRALEPTIYIYMATALSVTHLFVKNLIFPQFYSKNGQKKREVNLLPFFKSSGKKALFLQK